jgi:hypothetical protein
MAEGLSAVAFKGRKEPKSGKLFRSLLRKVSIVTGAGMCRLYGKAFNRRDRREQPECAEKSNSSKDDSTMVCRTAWILPKTPKIRWLKIFSAISTGFSASSAVKGF